jgi:hypothetical protein
MAMIITNRPEHLLSEWVTPQVTAWVHHDGAVISDAAALTIASWWQGPDPRGMVFAQLSTTGRVHQDEILAAANVERGNATSGKDDEALCALIGWAEAMCKLCGHVVRDSGESTGTLVSEADQYGCPTPKGEISGHQVA